MTAASPSRIALSRDRVIAEAIAIADAEGLEALTVRKLGAALDAHPSSIYHHLDGKDALLDGVREALLAEVAFPVSALDWRDWVRGVAIGLTELARLHPGAFKVFTLASTGPVGINLAVAGLEAFSRDGFDAQAAHDAMTGTALAILGLALDECVLPREAAAAPSADDIAAVVDAHPGLAAYASVQLDRQTRRHRIIEALITGLEATPR